MLFWVSEHLIIFIHVLLILGVLIRWLMLGAVVHKASIVVRHVMAALAILRQGRRHGRLLLHGLGRLHLFVLLQLKLDFVPAAMVPPLNFICV